MVHRVYDISDLVETTADADNLIRRITTTIEPDSWYDISDTGEGTITAYPLRQPKEFAVQQTRKIHQKIKRFLDDMRSSRDELLKTEPKILIDTKILSVSEDFLKDIGLDADSVSSSGAWSEHLVADSAADPNSDTYSLILDELHVSFLLRALGAHKDAYVLASPQVLCLEGKKAEITIMTKEYYYVKGYNEPNSPSDKPQQKLDKVEIGTHLWLQPILTPDNKNVDLDLKLEITQLKGIIEGKYKGKYPYQKPIIDVISKKMPCTIPDGKTMLIGGLKINEQVTKEPSTFIGDLFKRGTIKHKILLVLVKTVLNPQQKATKILPGQKDSEEHIRRLAEQLEKKLNRPDKPK
jgi:Flp pilus assembly secretin CpaC